MSGPVATASPSRRTPKPKGVCVLPYGTEKFPSLWRMTTLSFVICCEVRRTTAMLMLRVPPGRVSS